MKDIFLSYSRDDQATARRFAEGLEHAGFSVWWDVTLRSGEDYDKVTEAALESAKAVVVLWSKKSVESRWVRAEATQADRNHTLVPVMIEPCKRPLMFELKQTAELGHWKGDANDAAWLSFVSDVKRFTHKDSASANTNTTAGAGKPKRKLAPLISLTAAVVVLAVASLLKFATTAGTGSTATTSTTAAAMQDSKPQQKTIVVLPFRDLSANGDQAHLADGFPEEIRNLLGRVEGLLVINKDSANQFRGQEANLADIRQTLKVAYLLAGSVRMQGDDLRIGVQLSSTEDGHQLWSTTYERKRNDIFAVQEEIATKVSQALQITFATGIFGRTKGMTRNVEAYEEYLKAQDAPRDSRGVLAAGLQNELAHLEKALVLDPDFAVASEAIYELYQFGVPLLAAASDYPEREQRTAKALAHVKAINPDSPALSSFEAQNSANNGQWLAAERHFNDALEKQARLQGVGKETFYLGQAIFLQETGRARESIPYFRRAQAADPLNLDITRDMPEALASTGKFEEALDINAALLAQPGFENNTTLAGARLTLILSMDPALLDKFPSSPASASNDINTVMIANHHNPQRALELLRERARNTDLSAQALHVYATWAAYFGDPQYALELLQRRIKISKLYMGTLVARPVFASMRKLPGFKQLVTDLGLVDYWRASKHWGDFCRPLPNTENDFECF